MQRDLFTLGMRQRWHLKEEENKRTNKSKSNMLPKNVARSLKGCLVRTWNNETQFYIKKHVQTRKMLHRA